MTDTGRKASSNVGVAFALFLAVASLRYAFAANRVVFHLFPDEAAQLAIARNLSGETPWSMLDHSTWQPALGTMLVPFYWLGASSQLVYRVGIVANCVFAGLAAVVLALIVQRTTKLSLRSSAVLSGCIALLPAGLSASGHLWAEPLVTLTFLGSMYWALKFVASQNPGAGLIAILVAGFGNLAHGRGLPTLAVATLLVIGIHAMRRAWRDVAVASVVAATVVMTVHAFSAYVVERAWTSADETNSAAATLRRLGDPVAVLDAAIGQLWYQLVATIGLVGLGLMVLFNAIAGRPGGAGLRLKRNEALTVLAFVGVSVATSIVFMSGRDEPHYRIYGRYNDAIVWIVIAYGALWVARSSVLSRRRVATVTGSLAGVMLALSIIVDLAAGDVLRQSVGINEMVSGILPYIGRLDSVHPVRIGILAMGLMCAAVAGMRVKLGGWPATVLVSPVVLAAAGFATYSGLSFDLNQSESSQAVQEVRDIVPVGLDIGFHFVGRDEPSWVFTSQQRRIYQLYQYYLDDYELVPDAGLGDPVGPFVFAPREDPELVDAGARVLWESPVSGMVLWREP